jgi:hypothetical protein
MWCRRLQVLLRKFDSKHHHRLGHSHHPIALGLETPSLKTSASLASTCVWYGRIVSLLPCLQELCLLNESSIVAVSAARLVFLMRLDLKSPDVTWELGTIQKWTFIESNMGIVAGKFQYAVVPGPVSDVCAPGCLPQLRPVYKWVATTTSLNSLKSSIGFSSWRSTNGVPSTVRSGAGPLASHGSSVVDSRGSHGIAMENDVDRNVYDVQITKPVTFISSSAGKHGSNNNDIEMDPVDRRKSRNIDVTRTWDISYQNPK